jgi:hypothetical protein
MRAWTFSGLILAGVLLSSQASGGTDSAASVAAVAEPAVAAQNAADGSTVLPLGVTTTAAANASVSRWNSRALDLCVKYRRNPLRIARALAVLYAGIQDAVASIAATTDAPDLLAVAGDAAAGPVFDHLFPLETPGRFQALAWVDYAKTAASPAVDQAQASRARAVGSAAAERAIAKAMRDGSDLVWDPRQRPTPGPGVWRATPPLHSYDPLEPLAAQWTTWLLRDGGEVQPPSPVVYDTPAYWAETAEVLAVSRALTPEQARIADDWNLGQGSVTPAGVWNIKARALLERQGLDQAQSARVLAVLNIAMADAAVACWRAKYAYWTQRPVTAIRERLDPDWLPHLLTPSFPSYVSNHAVMSGAAAEVLAAYFPDSAAALDAAAAEAALSRRYGGIHFRSDNDEGLKLGRRVGRLILERLYGDRRVEPLSSQAVAPLLQSTGQGSR